MNDEATADHLRMRNTVLASLSQKEFARLRVALKPVSLKFGEVLYEPGKAIRHV